MGVIVAILGLLAGACGPAARPAVEQPTTAGSGATVAGQDPRGASEWDRIVAAARQEGKVTVLGPPGADAREGLLQGFQRRYPEIQVDFTGARGAEHSAKLVNERQAGQYLADVVVNGTTSQVDLLDANAMDPIIPYLVGPEIGDGSQWLDGRLKFADDAGQYTLVFLSAVKSVFAYNPRLVSVGEIKSYRDLLDPRWKGNIAMLDPRQAGAGLGFATSPWSG
jgi:iron(III) transport system substrate-binding protein